jgi:hypothetical protein
VKFRMFSAEMAPHPIPTKRGFTAPCRNASRRGISYYLPYETQTDIACSSLVGLPFTKTTQSHEPRAPQALVRAAPASSARGPP